MDELKSNSSMQECICSSPFVLSKIPPASSLELHPMINKQKTYKINVNIKLG
jgi:hypothetical protein